jgi:hypothetical protein
MPFLQTRLLLTLLLRWCCPACCWHPGCQVPAEPPAACLQSEVLLLRQCWRLCLCRCLQSLLPLLLLLLGRRQLWLGLRLQLLLCRRRHLLLCCR